MNTISLKIKYRPLRIGWCVLKDDIEGLRRALRLTHTLWGGRYNPVIPIDNFHLAEQLIRLFRVDFLISMSEGELVKNVVERFPWLKKPFSHSLFVEDSLGKLVPQVLDLCNPIILLRKAQSIGGAEFFRKVTLYDWEEDDPLNMALLASFGNFPEPHEVGADYCGLIETLLVSEKIHLSKYTEIPSDSYKKTTPNWISSLNLEPDYFVANAWDIPAPGFYIGDAADFEDIVNYWNLRATDTDLLFYDPSLKSRLDGIRREVMCESQEWPKNRKSERISVWRKQSTLLDSNDFSEILENCGGYTIYEGSWDAANIVSPMMHFEEKSVLASVSSDSGNTVISFALPEKPYVRHTTSHFQHFVASINLGSGLYDNEQETITLPFLPELNRYYGRCFYDRRKIRVEPESLGIIVNDLDDDLTIDALNVKEVIAKVLELAGARAQLSQPGLKTARIIQQMGGGLQASRVFKIKGVRDLIEKFGPEKSFTFNNAKLKIGERDTKGKEGFADYEDLRIGTQKGPKLTPQDALQHLITHGVFRVGLGLNCPNCLLDFWIPLDDIRTHSNCDYCGQLFNITSQLKDRDWKFRRSGLFGKNDHQDGAIPVILTLQQMDTVFHRSLFLYSTQTELFLGTGSDPDCETDLVVLTQTRDHQVQMAIGECKNRQPIDEKDVDNLLKVAARLEARNISTFIIFSKLSGFTPEELELCRKVNDRLILFTARELESYELYEKTSKEFNISEYCFSFKDMVAVTQKVFYDSLSPKLDKC